MNPNTTLSGADGAPVLLLLAQEVRDQPHAHQGVHTHRWGVLQKLGAEAPAGGDPEAKGLRAGDWSMPSL